MARGMEREAVRVRSEGIERDEREFGRVRTQTGPKPGPFGFERGVPNPVGKVTVASARGTPSCAFDGDRGRRGTPS